MSDTELRVIDGGAESYGAASVSEEKRVIQRAPLVTVAYDERPPVVLMFMTPVIMLTLIHVIGHGIRTLEVGVWGGYLSLLAAIFFLVYNMRKTIDLTAPFIATLIVSVVFIGYLDTIDGFRLTAAIGSLTIVSLTVLYVALWHSDVGVLRMVMLVAAQATLVQTAIVWHDPMVSGGLAALLIALTVPFKFYGPVHSLSDGRGDQTL